MSPHEREQLQARFREAIDAAAKAVKPAELRACESRLNHVANGRIPGELRAQVGDVDHVDSALANATNMLRFMQTALTHADWPHELAGEEKTGAFFIFEHIVGLLDSVQAYSDAVSGLRMEIHNGT